MSRAAIRLLSSITDLYRGDVAAKVPGFMMLADVLHAVAACPYPRDALRAPPPANRTSNPLAALVESLPGSGPRQEIGDLFQAAEPSLDWQRETAIATKSGHDASVKAFLDGHAYVEIVGPRRLFRSANTRVGLLLMAPSILYPEHSHPAEEVYHVVSGTAEWWQQGEEWAAKPPGAVVHHPSGLPHATRTASEALLAVYCWRGPVEVAADDDEEPGKAKKGKGRKPTKAKK